MKTILNSIILLFSIACFAQVTDTENYVRSINYTEGVNINNVSNNNGSKIEKITYFDHINRQQQVIIINGGDNQTDLIQHFDYDGYGRSLYNYLPYAQSNNDGSFVPNAITNIQNFYNTKKFENTINPYSFHKIENSPRSRLEEIAAQGNDWDISQGHTIKYEYSKNSATDYVKHYGVTFINDNKEMPQLIDYGLYSIDELQKKIIKDENWTSGQSYENDHTTEIFRDKYGRDVLKRSFNKGKWHDTYYIYDDFGNLTFVLPPKINTYHSISQQPFIGQSYNYQDVETLFEQQADESSLNFSFSNTGQLYVEVEAEGEYLEFSDGVIMNLDFLDATFPNIDIGDLEFDNGDEGGLLFIYNGLLVISSTGDTDSGYFFNEFSIDLSNFQNSFNPPSIDQSQMDDLAYQYIYDYQNRIIAKKIPGKDWEYVVYDKLDRPILVQEGKLREGNKWLFTKYDQLNRPVYSGLMTTNSSRATLQNAVNTTSSQNQSESRVNSPIIIAGTSMHYSNSAYPTVNISELLTINYYDDYNWDISSLTNPNIVQGQEVLDNPRGMQTGSKVRVLGESSWVTNIAYFDSKKRLIFSGSKNEYFNSIDKTEMKLNFLGQQIKNKREHQKGTNPVLAIENDFSFNNFNRLITQKQKINGGPEELIRKNHYDELGRLIKKDIGNTEAQPLQEIDFEFNIRGWLKSINDPSNLSDDLFTLGLNYQNPEAPSASSTYNAAQYNGNISHVMWQTDNVDTGLRHYSYQFDALNRFKEAYFGENHKINNKYNARVYSYDRNGNIERLYRATQNPNNTDYGVGIDNLSYSYSGNQLDEVTDTYQSSSNGIEGFKDGNLTGLDYEYDVNGNMTKDNNKGIHSIQYNHLNLPTTITVVNGSTSNGTIRYVYGATGNKLSKEIVDNTPEGIQISTIDYVNGFIYETNNTGEKLKFFSHPEGYVETVGVGDVECNYFYQYRDHLGNVRLTFSDSNDDDTVTGATTEIFFDDFETASGWDSQGALYGTSLTYGGEHTKSGNVAGKLSSTSSVGIYAHSNTWIPINNSQTTDYIISGWVYSDGPGARFLLFMNEAGETGYATMVGVTEKNSITNRWIYLEKRISVPSNIDKLNFRVDLFYGSPGTVWYDNVSIRKVNDVNDIEIVEENNYYPFGLKHKGYNDVTSSNSNTLASKFKFNGIELEEVLGTNLYEMDFRQYDPAIARWTSIDPVTHFSMSTYTAFDNNPIYWSDPSGADSDGYYGKYDLEWGGYMMERGDPGYSDEGQSYGYFGDYSLPMATGDPAWHLGGGLDEVLIIAKKHFSITDYYKDLESQLGAMDYDPEVMSNMQRSFRGSRTDGMRGRPQYGVSNRTLITASDVSRGIAIASTAWGKIDSPIKYIDDVAHYKAPGAKYELKTVYKKAGKFRSGNAASFMNQHKIVKGMGHTFAIGGTLIDGYGVINYFYSDDPDAFVVTPAKAATNLTFTYIGLVGGPPGWIVSGVYFVVDATVGWEWLTEMDLPEVKQGSHGTTCFIKGTKILLFNGSIINIEDIKVGDDILSVNTETMNIEADMVLNIPKVLNTYLIIKAEFDNGVINEFSPAHPFWVKGKGWSVYDVEIAKQELDFAVKQLEVGDIVYYYNEGVLKETKIRSLDDTGVYVEMYNLEHVNKNHTFFANGILVHNKLGH